jgi:hypothetical protein
MCRHPHYNSVGVVHNVTNIVLAPYKVKILYYCSIVVIVVF